MDRRKDEENGGFIGEAWKKLINLRHIASVKERTVGECGGKAVSESTGNAEKTAYDVTDRTDITEKLKRALRVFLPALFSFAVSSVSPAFGTLPFGVALLCAADTLELALSVLVGMILSSFSMTANGVPFVFVAICTFSLRLALGGLGIVETGNVHIKKSRVEDGSKNIFSSEAILRMRCAFNTGVKAKIIVAAGASALLGLSDILIGSNFWYNVFGLIFGVIVTPVLCFAFSAVRDRLSHPTLRKAGVGALVYAGVSALAGFTVCGINISVTAAFLASVVTGYSCGVADGAVIGVFAGMGLAPYFCAVCPVAAMCAGAVGAYSAGAASLTAGALGISLALYGGGISAFSEAVPEIIISAGLFYPAAFFDIIPDDLLGFCEKGEDTLHDTPRAGTGMKNRLIGICDAMDKMSHVFSNLSARLRLPGNAETYSVCDEAFSVNCSLCGKREICHHRENFAKGAVVRSASDMLREKGKIDISALPPSMVRGCPSADMIISQINAEYRKLFESGMKGDKTAAIAADYGNIAGMIRESIADADSEYERNGRLSDELSERFAEKGISFEALSVYGIKRPQVFVRGFSARDLTYGTDDLKDTVEKVVGASFTEPEMSMDYDRLNMYMECRKRYFVKHGQYSERGGGSEANGDVITSFKGDREEFYMLICDGMGSGREASLTARISSLFLERMLGAGCSPRAALTLLNDFTRERKIECFSTVDLLKIDAYSGDALFIKSGAAPSFVLRNNRLFRIECDSMPVGIVGKLSAKTVDFRLQKGDYVIMLSDGIVPDGEECAWLYDMISDRKKISDKLCETAKMIAEGARAHSVRPDDATVGIIKIEEAV